MPNQASPLKELNKCMLASWMKESRWLFLLESHQLVADLRGERKFGMIEGMKDW